LVGRFNAGSSRCRATFIEGTEIVSCGWRLSSPPVLCCRWRTPTGDAYYISNNPSSLSLYSTITNATITNIGGADIVHGESSDDVIYGGTGNDTDLR